MLFFFSNGATAAEIYALSLHDALPISAGYPPAGPPRAARAAAPPSGSRPPAAPHRWTARYGSRSEEHTSELQSRFDLVCRLLHEKKKLNNENNQRHTRISALTTERTFR